MDSSRNWHRIQVPDSTQSIFRILASQRRMDRHIPSHCYCRHHHHCNRRQHIRHRSTCSGHFRFIARQRNRRDHNRNSIPSFMPRSRSIIRWHNHRNTTHFMGNPRLRRSHSHTIRIPIQSQHRDKLSHIRCRLMGNSLRRRKRQAHRHNWTIQQKLERASTRRGKRQRHRRLQPSRNQLRVQVIPKPRHEPYRHNRHSTWGSRTQLDQPNLQQRKQIRTMED